MLDLVRKTLLTGVGLAAITRDKIEEIGKDLAKNAEMSEQEGKQFVDDLVKRSEQVQKDLESRLEGMVRKAVERINVATKEDVARLTAKLEQLEQQLAQKTP